MEKLLKSKAEFLIKGSTVRNHAWCWLTLFSSQQDQNTFLKFSKLSFTHLQGRGFQTFSALYQLAKLFIEFFFFVLFAGSINAQDSPPPQNDTKTTENNNSFKIRNFTLSRRNAFLTILTAVCAFIAIVLLTIFAIYGDRLHKQTTLGDGDDSRKNIAINSTIGSSICMIVESETKSNFNFSLLGSDLLTGKVLRMISRDEWLAQPPADELADLILPVNRIIITHTATESCETQVGSKHNRQQEWLWYCCHFRLLARYESDWCKHFTWKARIGTT